MHSRYTDSSNPGPRIRCTSIAQPMILSSQVINLLQRWSHVCDSEQHEAGHLSLLVHF